MDRLNFLLGKWNLDYKVPKSIFSDEDFGIGKGEFKKFLNNKFVKFDYDAKLSKSKVKAHAIFGWDDKNNIYKYWWFENSGAFMEAACNFTNANSLQINWQSSLLVQTFRLIKNGDVIMRMNYPANDNDNALILEVIFTKV